MLCARQYQSCSPWSGDGRGRGSFPGRSLSPGSHSPEFHKLGSLVPPWSLPLRPPWKRVGCLDVHAPDLDTSRLCGLGMCRLPQIHAQRRQTHTHPNLSVCCWGFRGVVTRLGPSSTPRKGRKPAGRALTETGRRCHFRTWGQLRGLWWAAQPTVSTGAWQQGCGIVHPRTRGRDPSAVSPWGSPRLMASPAFQANHEHASLFRLARGCPETHRIGLR